IGGGKTVNPQIGIAGIPSTPECVACLQDTALIAASTAKGGLCHIPLEASCWFLRGKLVGCVTSAKLAVTIIPPQVNFTLIGYSSATGIRTITCENIREIFCACDLGKTVSLRCITMSKLTITIITS